MENVLDLLVEYSKKGRIVTRPALKNMLTIISREKDLDEYISRLIFNKLTANAAEYQYYVGTILMNQEKSKKMYYDTKAMLKEYKCPAFEKNIAGNAMILHLLLHEVEHANQIKESKNPNKNFENRLLAICLHIDNELLKLDEISLLLTFAGSVNEKLERDYLVREKLQKKYDDAAPIERLANINSVKEVINILNPLKEEIANIVDSFQNMVLYYYLTGYLVNGTGPTEKYLRDYRKLDISGTLEYFDDTFTELINEANNYPLEERLKLGLSISRKEYQNSKKNLA